jgi:hypothetical protein
VSALTPRFEISDDLFDPQPGISDAAPAQANELGRSGNLGGQLVDIDSVAVDLANDGIQFGHRLGESDRLGWDLFVTHRSMLAR